MAEKTYGERKEKIKGDVDKCNSMAVKSSTLD